MSNQEVIKKVEKELPEFVKACSGDEGTILLTQEAFANEEAELLGIAIKYAGIKNKEIMIIPA